MLIVVSCIVLLLVLRLALKQRSQQPAMATLIWVAVVVCAGGMLFAKVGANVGLPVWVYYGVPAALTWAFPPLVFRMRKNELARYLPLALLSAPVIHVMFSFFLGWKEYMPFIPVPSLWDLTA